jgi:hypothetical protein
MTHPLSYRPGERPLLPLVERHTRLAVGTGTLPSEQLPGLATDALSQGLDSPALRELAGTSPRDVRDARDFFLVALGELGITLLDEQQALWELVQSVPEQASLVACS